MAQRIQAEFTISSTSRDYANRVRQCFALFQQARQAASTRWEKEHKDKVQRSADDKVAVGQAWVDPNVDNGHENFVFLAVSRALGVIHTLEGLEFKGRTFYDITGSGGLAPLAAGMLFRFEHLKMLECLDDRLEAARNLVVSCRVDQIHDLHRANVSYQLGDPLTADFVEGDVVFVDATQLGFDEVALMHALLPKLEDLVSGSFIIVLTHVEDPYPSGCPFHRLDCGPSYAALEPCQRHVLLYKTVKRSKDLRIESPSRPHKAAEDKDGTQELPTATSRAAFARRGGGERQA